MAPITFFKNKIIYLLAGILGWDCEGTRCPWNGSMPAAGVLQLDPQSSSGLLSSVLKLPAVQGMALGQTLKPSYFFFFFLAF